MAVDGKDPVKQGIARKILIEALISREFLISAQVLNEFSNIALLKLKMSIQEVRRFVGAFPLRFMRRTPQPRPEGNSIHCPSVKFLRVARNEGDGIFCVVVAREAKAER